MALRNRNGGSQTPDCWLKSARNTQIAILPSSIHEAILLELTEEISIDYLNDMVREVNATQVEPTDRLIDHAIIVNF